MKSGGVREAVPVVFPARGFLVDVSTEAIEFMVVADDVIEVIVLPDRMPWRISIAIDFSRGC
jgi:hypothetical protein